MEKISLNEKFALIHELWRPKIAAQANGQELKLVKFLGVFPWHAHQNADELFIVWRGEIIVELPDQSIALRAGDVCVVPKGVQHRTSAALEAEVLVFEPAHTRNTGNIADANFTAPNGVWV